MIYKGKKQLRKSGNSRILTIPKEWIEDNNLERYGYMIFIAIDGTNISIVPCKEKIKEPIADDIKSPTALQIKNTPQE